MLGADRLYLALAFAAAWFAALVVLTTQSWARETLEETPLIWPGLMFLAVLAAAGVSLTPFGVGGPHPIWTLTSTRWPTVSVEPYATLVEMLKLLALAAAFLIGVAFGGDDDRARRLIRAIQYLGLAYGVWAFLDQVLTPRLLFEATSLDVTRMAYDSNRLSATLYSPNTAATLFSALSLLNLADVLRRLQKETGSKSFHARDVEALLEKLAFPLISLAVSMICLVMTVSRSGMLACAVAAVFLVVAVSFAQAKRGAAIRLTLVAAAILGLGMAGLAIGSQQLAERGHNYSADLNTRTSAYVEHWKAFLMAPWQGYGLGSVPHVNAMIMNQANRPVLDYLNAVHNVYIQWLEQAGVIGAVPMFLTIALIALQIGAGVFRRRRMRVWLIAILAVLLLFLVHGATDIALEIPSMAAFLSLLLGLGYRVARPR